MCCDYLSANPRGLNASSGIGKGYPIFNSVINRGIPLGIVHYSQMTLLNKLSHTGGRIIKCVTLDVTGTLIKYEGEQYFQNGAKYVQVQSI